MQKTVAYTKERTNICIKKIYYNILLPWTRR